MGGTSSVISPKNAEPVTTASGNVKDASKSASSNLKIRQHSTGIEFSASDGIEEPLDSSNTRGRLSSFFGRLSPSPSRQGSILLGSINPLILNVPSFAGYPFVDYRFVRKIGSGAFSTVHKAHSVSDEHVVVAIKEVDTSRISKKHMADLHTEMNILSQLRHNSIVRFYSVYTTRDRVYMVMEYLSGGELLNAISKQQFYTEGDARRVLVQVAGALQYMHSKRVIHRDLKPENIILETYSLQSNVKIIDFGFAIMSTDAVAKYSSHVCGTPGEFLII